MECAVTFGFVESDKREREGENFEERHKRGDGMEIVCGDADNFLPQIVSVLNLWVACRRLQPPARVFLHKEPLFFKKKNLHPFAEVRVESRCPL